MKKLLTLLFTAVIAFSLAMPVFADGAGTQDTTAKATKEKKTKAAKAKKTKAAKDKKTAPATKE